MIGVNCHFEKIRKLIINIAIRITDSEHFQAAIIYLFKAFGYTSSKEGKWWTGVFPSQKIHPGFVFKSVKLLSIIIFDGG